MSDANIYKNIPSVDLVLRHIADSGLGEGQPRPLVVRAVRRALERARQELGGTSREETTPEAIRTRVLREAELEVGRLPLRAFRPLINATGVVVHTNLGRAPLSERALALVCDTSRGYSNLEYDLERGARGKRDELVREALCELTGSQAALVVNNNAAAVLLALNTLALGREVIISRSELIEIGGSFRLPEVFERSGARMVPVGSTNRTHAHDFEKAINNRTAAVMSAHWSNYHISGFVDRVEIGELAAISRRRGLPLIHDLGSGIIGSADAIGLAGEMTLRDSVSAGATVVTASGDKILGGPQSGIVVGEGDAVDRMSSNPLMRALRPGKLTLAALQATLEAYLSSTAATDVPVLRMLSLDKEALMERATSLVSRISDRCGAGYETDVVDTVARVGGGAAPERGLASCGLAVRADGMGAEELARRLRTGEPPVIARTVDERLVLDLRTVMQEQDATLVEALRAALERKQ